MGEKLPILVFTNKNRRIAKRQAPLIDADLYEFGLIDRAGLVSTKTADVPPEGLGLNIVNVHDRGSDSGRTRRARQIRSLDPRAVERPVRLEGSNLGDQVWTAPLLNVRGPRRPDEVKEADDWVETNSAVTDVPAMSGQANGSLTRLVQSERVLFVRTGRDESQDNLMSSGQRCQVVMQPLGASIGGDVGRLRAEEEDPHQSLQASSYPYAVARQRVPPLA